MKLTNSSDLVLKTGKRFKVMELVVLGEKPLRLFIPDWNQMINSKTFLDPLQKTYKLRYIETDLYGLEIDYYLMNTTPILGTKRKDFSDKFARNFNTASMLYSKLFNMI